MGNVKKKEWENGGILWMGQMEGGKGEFGLKPHQKSHIKFGGGIGWPEGGSMGWPHFTTLRPAEVLPSTFKCDFYLPSSSSLPPHSFVCPLENSLEFH
jgi:hypothetical protein